MPTRPPLSAIGGSATLARAASTVGIGPVRGTLLATTIAWLIAAAARHLLGLVAASTLVILRANPGLGALRKRA